MSTATAFDLSGITRPTPSGCKPLDNALCIPVGLIEPSPLNPRKRWKPGKVAEMVQDLRTNAQIQPIRVRPNPRHTAGNGRPPYEIVVGETRWRAAPDAGLATLDAIVGDCTDQQLIQLALSENTKRQDLHPLEEADGFDALLRKPDGLQGYATVPELAGGVGVSTSYIYQRLKLRALCAAGREAFLDGKIDASVALLIARMPNAEEQARATARILTGFGGEPYSYRQAVEYLQREFMLRLTLARFDITASYKVAGPCAECPKRSGAAPDLFADVTAGDMCQDARCYQAKAEEAHQALLQAAREAGRTVLQGAAARKVLPNPDATPVGHYRLDAPCTALTDSKRTLRDLLGKGTTAQIVVVDLPDTTPVELVPEEAARKALKARSLLREQAQPAAAAAPSPAAKPASPAPAAPAPAAQPAASATTPPKAATPAGPAQAEGGGEVPWWEDERNKVKKAEATGAHADAETLERFGHLLAAELQERLADAAELPPIVMRLVLSMLFEDMLYEEASLLYSVAGWNVDEAVAGKGLALDFDGRVGVADARLLGELLALALVVVDCTSGQGPMALMKTQAPTAVLANHFGIDLDRVMRNAHICVSAQRGAGVLKVRRALPAES